VAWQVLSLKVSRRELRKMDCAYETSNCIRIIDSYFSAKRRLQASIPPSQNKHRQRRLSHHRRGQLSHVTIQMYRGSAQFDACARAGWYAREIGSALRSEIAATGWSAKNIMGWTPASERAVKGWISGKRVPSGGHLIPLMACSDAVFAAVLRVTGRERSSCGGQVAEVRRLLREAAEALHEVDQ
jgi:hypothetical protein